jgi:hypothetical protein
VVGQLQSEYIINKIIKNIKEKTEPNMINFERKKECNNATELKTNNKDRRQPLLGKILKQNI